MQYMSNIRSPVFLCLWLTPQVINRHKEFWWRQKTIFLFLFSNFIQEVFSHMATSDGSLDWRYKTKPINKIRFSENLNQTETYPAHAFMKHISPRHHVLILLFKDRTKLSFAWKVKGLPFFFSVQLMTKLLIPLFQLTNLLLLSLLCLLCLFPSWAQLR